MDPAKVEMINEEVLPYLPTDRIREGNKLLFRCPICGDSKRFLNKKRGYYYLTSASYHCFNCDITISGIRLLSILSGEDFDTVNARFFGKIFDGKHYTTATEGHSLDSPNHEADSIFAFKSVVNPKWKMPLTDRAREYLSRRRVLEAPFLKESLYSYVAGNGNEYILIPWRINGVDAYYQLNDFLGIREGRKYVFPKGLEKTVYGVDNIDLMFPYIICFEGVYDSLFVPNGVAIGGKNLTNRQARFLKKRFPHHKLVMSLDNDRAGLEAMARSMRSTNLPYRMMYYRWFDANTKAKDVNDLVLETGNVNILSDKKIVSSRMETQISMAMWLAGRGIKVGSDKTEQCWARKIRQCAQRHLRALEPVEVQGTVSSDLQVRA